MHSTQRTLALAALLALGLTATANAHDQRGRDYRDGHRHKHVAAEQRRSKFRAERREHRREERRAARHFRQQARDDWYQRQVRRAHKRAQREARRDLRAWRRAEKRARKQWRRHVRAQQRADRYYYDRYDRFDDRETYRIWLDGVGFVWVR